MAELTKLGRYQLRGVLGRGAMGVVYEGFDPTIGRRVAVKTILKNAAIDDETARAYSALFAREAQAAGRLSHPNIIQVYDFAEEQDIAYLVMEFIQGRELRSYFVARETFDAVECVRIMGELLDALDFAHEAGVIHRDIKPANVMLDAQRRVKLADFGVARIQESERSAAGTMVGTPAFMSPEQISGGKIDRRTDVFSAGTILYQLLTGEQPFTGDGAWTVAKKIMQDDPPRPSSVAVNVSPAFDAIVNRALAKKPADRFASAREFAAALRGVAGASAQSQAAVAIPSARVAKPAAKASDAEVEFWRAIQNSSDPDEIAFYLEQFPEGTYASLARHKIVKLREPESAARKAGEETVRLEAQAKARLEAEQRAQREAEEQAQRKQAEEQARQEAEAKTRLEAEQRARREAEEQAQRKQAEEQSRQEAETKTRHEALEKAKREAAEKVRREADEKARRETEEKVRQAQALARLRQQEEAVARAKPAVDEDATVAIGSERPAASVPAALPAERKKSYVIPAAAAAVVIVIGIGAYLFLGRTPAPAPVAQIPAAPKVESPVAAAPPKAEVSAADIDKIRKETENRVRREYADKSAAEQAAAMKAAADKAVQEKQLAAKAAAEKAVLDKAAADKASVEKVAAEKAMAAKVSAESAAAAQKVTADKAAADQAAAEKAAAEKVAADKAAAAKAAAAAKPGWPSVGDRWVYEAREANNPDRKYQTVVDIVSVSPAGIRDTFRTPHGTVELTHQSAPLMVGMAPGIASFVPYLRAFQELRGGERWASVEFKSLWNCSGGNTYCSISARVIGKERLTVRAGTYDAWKVVVDLGVRAERVGGSGEFVYWYSEEVKRLVKYQSRINVPTMWSTQPWTQPNMDMELVYYTPAGSK